MHNRTSLAIASRAPRLASVVRAATHAAMVTAWRDAGGWPPHEPDFIAHLVTHAVPTIHREWNRVLGGMVRVDVAGAYCHQRPYVRFHMDHGEEGRCEIGDLLLCHAHGSNDGVLHQQALLLQAKRVQQNGQLRLPNDAQSHLYTRWPTFEYDSPPLRGKRRSIGTGTAHPGAEYLLLDGEFDPHHWQHADPMRVASPAMQLVPRQGLPEAMVDLVLGRSGASYAMAPPRGPPDEWPRVVQDLLYASRDHVFTRTRSGMRRQRRLTGRASDMDGLVLTGQKRGLRSWVLARDDDPPQAEEAGDDEDSSGIPFILIHTRELQE